MAATLTGPGVRTSVGHDMNPTQSNLITAADFLKVLAKTGGSMPTISTQYTVRGDLRLSSETLGEEVKSLHIARCIFTGSVSIHELKLEEKKNEGMVRLDDCQFMESVEVGQCSLRTLSVSEASLPRLHIWCSKIKDVWLGNLQIEKRLDFSDCDIAKDLHLSGCTFDEFALSGNNGPSRVTAAVIDEHYGNDHRLEPDHREQLLECACLAATQFRYMGVPVVITTAMARRLNGTPVSEERRLAAT